MIRFSERNKLEFYSDLVMYSATVYLLLKKAFNVAISDFISRIFAPEFVPIYYLVAGATLVLALVVKLFHIAEKHWPISFQRCTTPHKVATGIQNINLEIIEHLKECSSAGLANVKKLVKQHQFGRNIRLVVGDLAEHIQSAFGDSMECDRDLFISLYRYDQSGKELRYLFHCPSQKDQVQSRDINLDHDSFQRYECVKCMKSTQSTIYLLDKDHYHPGNVDRAKVLRHYMGTKIESDSEVFGFLNIEFHNKRFFFSDAEMIDFMEKHIFPFKTLIEYQFLKENFYQTFEKFEEHWEVV